MKRLIIAMLVIVALAVSCGQRSLNTDMASKLQLILSSIPSELASDSILWYSDIERIKQLAGAPPDTDYDGYAQLVRATSDRAESQRLMNLLAGATPSDFSGGTFAEYWKGAFGYDTLMLNQEVVASTVVQPNATRPLFSVMRGNFDKANIIEKLKGLGYEQKTYSGINYYSIRADYQTDLTSSQASRMAMANLNRMMVEDDEIAAAPAEDIFYAVLDVRRGKGKALEGSPPYARIAQSMGNLLGAALIPSSQLRSSNVNASWDRLHAFDLAAIGYWMDGKIRKAVIAIHYPDKSAGSDINQVKERMAEYRVYAGLRQPQALGGLFEIDEPIATVYGSESVLKVELIYRADTPSTMWSSLVEGRDLGFLVSNPSPE